MRTQCISDQLEFEGFDGRRVVAGFDGGRMTSDAGALLLREADRVIALIDRVAACFTDGRNPGGVVHTVRTLVGQRIIGLALGYEDVNDHDTLRFDPVLGLSPSGWKRSARTARRWRARARSIGSSMRPPAPATATTRSATTRRLWRMSLSTCFWTPMPRRPGRS
jgi:hypothetical protein